jgi:transcriptional regulator with XRE-family HTH domain
MDKLAKALEQKRLQEGMTVAGMASRLGVSDSCLFLLRDGKRSPGVRFLRAVIRAFPDLQLLVFEYLAQYQTGDSETERSDD